VVETDSNPLPLWSPSRQRVLDPFLDNINAMITDPAKQLGQDQLAVVLDPKQARKRFLKLSHGRGTIHSATD
jgi:hypothetical protein